MLKIKLARSLGFCSGVRRAIDLAEKTLAQSKAKVYSLGWIIHNPQVISCLKEKGLNSVDSVDSLERLSTLILPSHGCPKSIKAKAMRKGLRLVDVTCPYVSSVHKICNNLSKNKYTVIIVGDRKHPEVKALTDLAPGAVIIEDISQVRQDMFSYKKIGIISQTTQAREKFLDIVKAILETNKSVSEVHIYNTICLDTSNRQKEVTKLAHEVDTLLVIGSSKSANTKRLLALGRNINKKTFLVEEDTPALEKVLKNAKKVGIISGASAPKWLVDSIVSRIKKIK